MTNQTAKNNVKPGDIIRIGCSGMQTEWGAIARVTNRPAQPGADFFAEHLHGDHEGRALGYNFASDFEVLAVAAPAPELDAHRPGDEFPNVGYVRRMTGQDRVETKAA